MSRRLLTPAFIILLAAVALGSWQPMVGDAGEYTAMTQRMIHLRPPLHTTHFWFYSALSAPLAGLAGAAGLPVTAAFSVLNVILLAAAFRIVLARAGAAATVFLFVSPILWWIDKPHTEVFTFSLLAVAFVLLDTSPWWSIVALGAASTQNPPIAAVMGLVVCVNLARASVRRDRRFLLAAGVAVALATLHPLYYLLTEGRLSPLLAGTAGRMPTWQEFGAALWDPTIGLLWCFPPYLFVLVAAAVVVGRRGSWRALVQSTGLGIAAGAVLLLLFSFASTMNVSHGATPGMSRYALWLIPLVLPVLATFDTPGDPAARRWLVALLVVSASWSLVFFNPRVADGAMRPSPAARLLWTRWPSLDNPLPEIFAESLHGSEDHSLPVATPHCEKILLLGTGGIEGLWPVPCRPATVPSECVSWGALCYANLHGREYTFTRVPQRYRGFTLDTNRVWPAPAENAVGRLLDDLKWWEMEVMPEGAGAMLRAAFDVRGVYVLQSPDRLFIYMARTAAGARLMLRLPAPMRGRILDLDAGQVIERVQVEGGGTTPAFLAVPGPASHLVLVLAR